jgi:ubiquinone/menaquinone biosynthesis C-methylase UbiE
MQNKERVKRGFNLLAPVYDAGVHVFFGKSLEHSQAYFLPALKPCTRILLFGGGSGYLLPRLLALGPDIRICYLDISEKMMAMARVRVMNTCPSQLGSVDFICGSYSEIPADFWPELIITPFVMDCFREEELPLVFSALASCLRSSGQWLFVDFHKPAGGAPWLLHHLLIRPLYVFFNIVCGLGIGYLPEFEKHFTASGFRIKAAKLFHASQLTARIYER